MKRFLNHFLKTGRFGVGVPTASAAMITALCEELKREVGKSYVPVVGRFEKMIRIVPRKCEHATAPFKRMYTN